MTERAEELVYYGPEGAPQALLEAQEIAESIGGATPSERDAVNRTVALLMVWCGLAAVNPSQAERFIAKVASAAARIGHDGPALAIRMTRALAASDPDGAVRFAESVRDENSRFRALATVASLIAADEPEQAEYLARGIADPGQRVVGLTSVAARVARTDPDQAERLTAEAEIVAHKEVPEDTRSAALCAVIEAAAEVDPVHAGQIASQLPGDDIGEIRRACAVLAVAWADTDPDIAERLARSQESPAHQSVALAQVAAALLPANPARAAVLASEADVVATEVRERFGPTSIITTLTYQRMAGAFAATDAARALGYARAIITAPETVLIKVDTLVDIATAVPAQRDSS